MARSHSEPGSCLTAEPQSVSGHSPCDPSRTQWQPIATAPRDGSEFLAACDRVADGFQQVVFWDDECVHPGWGTKDSDAVCPFGFFTHWRHLPAPPAQGMEARSAETLGSARQGDSPVGRQSDAPSPEASRQALTAVEETKDA
jgi:hypothetical protein